VRIAVVTGTFPVPSQTFVVNQITGLLDRGHEIDVFGHAPASGQAVNPDVARYDLLARTHHWPTGGAALAACFRLGARHPGVLARALRAGLGGQQLTRALTVGAHGPYDLLYCHFGPMGLIGAELKRAGLAPALAVAFHGFDLSSYVRQHGNAVYAPLLREADLLLPVSDFFRRELLALGTPEARVRVHHMGVDSADLGFAARRPADGGLVRVVTMARLVEKKGVQYALDAVAQVLRERPGALTYHVVGDGPLRAELEAQAERNGLREYVTFHGWKGPAAATKLLDEMHLMLLPSTTAADGDREGIPVSLMEAMARGLPVVSTRHSGIPELVEAGCSGFLAEERDVPALAECLRALLDHPEMWSGFGRAGRERVEEAFDIHRLNDDLSRHLDSIVSSAT
jgi:colanic acid/amylovoran biosynthesis glycosyltransferase